MNFIWDNVGLKEIKSFDYKPFGELDGGDEPTKHGFATAEYDGESSCFAMGMRMYSAELGRFLSVDPLFEAMPRHTPYHYSFNSPLVWKDSSGLIPEKEKDQDRLMEFAVPDLSLSEGNYLQCVTEVDFAGNEVRALNKEMDDRKSETENARERGRLGTEGSGDNGTVTYYYLGTDKNGYHYGVLIIDLPDANILMDVMIKENAVIEGNTADDMLQKLADAYQKVLDLDGHFFDPLIGGDFLINIWAPDDITSYYNSVVHPDARLIIGLFSRDYDKSRMTFFYSGALFGDIKDPTHFYEKTNWLGNIRHENFELWEVVAHETGHYIDFLEQGFVRYDFLWQPLDREHSTINRLNKLRLKTNRPQEVLPWR